MLHEKPQLAPQTEMLEDEDVIRRVIAGEPALFELIMRRYNQRVYRTIRAILRDDAEVEDALQQAYINAYRNLAQFEGTARFSTWLLRIALHEALARARRKTLVLTGERREGEQDPIALAPSKDPNPEQNALSSELKDILERQIMALPEMYRLVFMMRELEELSTEETALALDVTTDVVKTRLHRARAMLRTALYSDAGISAESLFSFGDSRCDRVVTTVLERIATLDHSA